MKSKGVNDIRYKICKRIIGKEPLRRLNFIELFICRLIATTYPKGSGVRMFGYFNNKT